MTGAAVAAGDVIVAGERKRRRRFWGSLQLVLPPFDEVGIGIDVYDKRHLGVLGAAIFGALAAIYSDLLRRDGDVRVAARDKVLLPGEAWNPEAVDHVVRLQHDPNRHPYRQVNLVGRAHHLRSVG